MGPSRGRSRRRNLRGRQSQGNVAVRRVLPGSPSLLLGSWSRRRVDVEPSAAAAGPQRSIVGAGAQRIHLRFRRGLLLLGHRVEREPSRVRAAHHGARIRVYAGGGHGRGIGRQADHHVRLLRRLWRLLLRNFPRIHLWVDQEGGELNSRNGGVWIPGKCTTLERERERERESTERERRDGG